MVLCFEQDKWDQECTRDAHKVVRHQGSPWKKRPWPRAGNVYAESLRQMQVQIFLGWLDVSICLSILVPELSLLPGKVWCHCCTLALSDFKPSALHAKYGELTAFKQFRSNYYEGICERSDITDMFHLWCPSSVRRLGIQILCWYNYKPRLNSCSELCQALTHLKLNTDFSL